MKRKERVLHQLFKGKLIFVKNIFDKKTPFDTGTEFCLTRAQTRAVDSIHLCKLKIVSCKKKIIMKGLQ